MSANTLPVGLQDLTVPWMHSHPSGATVRWDPDHQMLTVEGARSFFAGRLYLHSQGRGMSVVRHLTPAYKTVMEEVMRYYLTLLEAPAMQRDLKRMVDILGYDLFPVLHLDLVLEKAPPSLTPRQQASWCLTEFFQGQMKSRSVSLPPPVRDEAWRLSYIDETLASLSSIATTNEFLRAFYPAYLLWGDANWLPLYLIDRRSYPATAAKTLEGLTSMGQLIRGLQASPQKGKVKDLLEGDLAKAVERRNNSDSKFASLPLRSREIREYFLSLSVDDLHKVVGRVKKGGDAKTIIALSNALLQEEHKKSAEEAEEEIPWQDLHATLGALLAYLQVHDERFTTTTHYGERTFRIIAEMLGSLRRNRTAVYRLLKEFLREQEAREVPSKALVSVLGTLLDGADNAFSKGQPLNTLLPQMAIKMDATSIVETLILLKSRGEILSAKQWKIFLDNYEAYKDMPGDWWLPLVKAS